MRKIEILLKEEMEELKQIVTSAKQRLANVPEGILRVRTWNRKTEYYYRNSTNKNTKESRDNGKILKEKRRKSGEKCCAAGL